MATPDFIVGIIGNIISILLCASPVKTFRQVVKKKSVENYGVLPYISALLCKSLWAFYGFLDPDRLPIVTINCIGVAAQFTYVTLYLIYTPTDKKVKLMILVAILNIVLPASVIMVTLLAFHGCERQIFVGVMCAAVTVAMYAAPLSVVRTVIKTQSVEYMPFFLSFFLFLNGGVWVGYAALVKDYYIGVPNAIGFVLGSAQLIIYMMYMNKTLPPKSVETMEEEGSAHLDKGGIEMQDMEEDEEEETKNRSLNKGRSLPKPSFSRQYSVQRIPRTLSLSPYELQSSLPDESDVENGGSKAHL